MIFLGFSLVSNCSGFVDIALTHVVSVYLWPQRMPLSNKELQCQVPSPPVIHQIRQQRVLAVIDADVVLGGFATC